MGEDDASLDPAPLAPEIIEAAPDESEQAAAVDESDAPAEIEDVEDAADVEDVVSSGSQALAAAAQLRAVGADVQGILCIIDREQGGAERIQAKGYEFKALFSRSDLNF
jgi:orotate phosphoribosyltransferase